MGKRAKREHVDVAEKTGHVFLQENNRRYVSRAFKPELKNKPQRRVVAAPRRPRKTR